MFEAINLDIGFSKNILVSRVNQTFEAGKIYTIIGDNGAGKTTFIKTLTGFVPIVSGSVLFNKRTIDSFSLAEKSKIFSILFSKNNIDPMIKVNEIFEFSLGIKSRDLEKSPIFLEFNEVFEISYLLSRPFGVLSDGQRQLVLIARSLMKKASVYILDEPTIYLDLKTKEKLIHYLKTVLSLKKSLVIMISHDASFVNATTDHSLKIENGVLS